MDVIAASILERRLETLLEASSRLSQSIDYLETLENVVRFVAERFASYSLLDVIGDDGRIERVSAAHGDPTRQALVERILAYHPPADLVETHPVARAVARRETTLETIDDAWIERAAISPGHALAMRELEPRTLLVVPVTSGSRLVGALTCALDRHAVRTTFDADDVAVAEELGRRAGLAIEHARLYEHERRIAFALQAASLPQILPASNTLRLDAYYRPARREATIGGDWYDAFPLDDGRTALTLGDVAGKGLGAAVTMGRLRQAMQSAAMLAPRTDAMLDVADRTLSLQGEDVFATAVAVIFDPVARTFALSSAGHPAAMVRRPDGAIERLHAPGSMLGIGRTGVRDVAERDVERGSLLVLFTDGLVESTRDIDEGERRLAAILADPAIVDDPRPARTLVDAILGTATPHDDIAVLVATVL